ncbi:MAG: hypothetical protein R3C49_24655 [Planctomycetaceae bacterium]
MLANVHEMKVEIFDERRGDFVVPGYGTYSGAAVTSGVNGDFHVARNLNMGFGADDFLNGAVFDTWHPEVAPVGSPVVHAPYKCTSSLRQRWPMVERHPTAFRWNLRIKAIGNQGQVAVWTTSLEMWSFRISFLLTLPPRGNLTLEWTNLIRIGDFQRAFRCVAAVDTDGSGSVETDPSGFQPDWSTTPGRLITDGEVKWEVVDNVKPLKSIRVTIRFRNEKSGLMRQLTLVLPLTDETT